MRRTIELTNLNGQTAVGILSGQLPMALDYMAFYFVDESGNVLIADMSDFKLYMNADLVRQYSGIQGDSINQGDFLDSFVSDNIFSVHLDQLRMKTIEATYGTTMNTLSPDPVTGKTITSSRFELTTNAGLAPAWRVFADVDDAGAGGPGFVERVRVYGNNTIGTSEKSFDNVLPFGTLDVRFWRRLFVSNVSAGNITLGRILRGSGQEEVFKRTRNLDLRILADYAVRQLVAPTDFLFDGTETGIPETWDTMMIAGPQPGGDAPPGLISVGQMSARLTNSGAATCDLILDTIGSF